MKIYVGNLGAGVSGQDLRAAFGVYGQVTSAQVSTDYLTGASRGFGFVVMTVRGHGEAAITGLDGKEPRWQVMLVQEGRSSQRLRQKQISKRSPSHARQPATAGKSATSAQPR
jgi:RNA recognition motif-containing protein